ncbi:MAG: thioredoxin domain-containing protein [Methylobacteriaceae bacterium]|nr:thioredoxin domain-containing protein [Methylobacteriaceae bacterium]
MFALHKSRRDFVKFAAAGALVTAVPAFGPMPAFAQNARVDVEQLMAEEALPDVVEGQADAPVTIVEYASMTCSHCAAFANNVFPTLKSKYIDTGKAKYILREFPLDPLATAGFMLARCSGDKREAMITLLFAQQKNWAFVEKPLDGLANIVKQTGMGQEGFEKCLKDQALYDKVNLVRDRGAEKFNVNATPTFFINGKRVSGEMTVDQLDKEITPLLPKG